MRHRLCVRLSRMFLLSSISIAVLVPGITRCVFAQTPTTIAISPANPVISTGQTQNFSLLSADGTIYAFGQAKSIATGTYSTCALLGNGTVQCWGGTSTTPVAVSGLHEVTAISSGTLHACALLTDGTVACWGSNLFGQLGNTNTINSSRPVAVSGLSGVVAISSGGLHTCALLANGIVKCWGYNGAGQLGNATAGLISAIPVTATGVGNATAVSSGAEHSCALLADGTAQCWGDDKFGELGNGQTNVYRVSTPVTVNGLSGAIAISASGYHTCALLGNGTAECWGNNYYGQLGNGTTQNSSTPVAVTGLDNVNGISTGVGTTCALLGDGTVRCWGDNAAGELGAGTGARSTTPVTVNGLTGITAVSSGAFFTCALLGDGNVQCLGLNNAGQLGNGTTKNSATPVTVVAGSAGKALPTSATLQTSSGWFTTFALLTNGTVDLVASGPVSGLSGVKAIAGWDECALLTSGMVQCWGGGSGTVNGLSGVKSIAQYGACASLTNGTVECAIGEAGSLTDVKSVDGACSLLSNGTVECWGWNQYGQLGNPDYGWDVRYWPTPVMVSGLSGVKAITAGNAHNCALRADGTVWCWGRNNDGQLGDGTRTNSLSIVQVNGLSGVAAISSGEFHTCALLMNGTVYCWGDNENWKLGTPSILGSTSPLLVGGLSGVGAISASVNHTCALLANGSLECWGDNQHGELGNGTYVNSATPVPTQVLITTAAWATGNPQIALIDALTGIATAESAGTTVITGTYGGVTATTNLTVNQSRVTRR